MYYFHKKPQKTISVVFLVSFFGFFWVGFLIANPAIRRTVKDDPRFKSYARRRTQFLSEVMTKSRAKKLDRSSVEKAKKLDKASVAKACRRSRTRIKAVVETNGHLTE